MFKRRSIALLLAGAAIFFTTSVCGSGSLANAPGAPAPTVDLSQPSGGGAPESTSAAMAATEPLPETEAAASTFPLVNILPTGTALPATEELLPAPPAAIPESRRVTLEFPPMIRAGDSDVVRLTLEVDTLGNVTPTAETQGNTVKGQVVKIPNLYDTHNVIAEARLELAGVDLRPASGDMSEPLLPGQSVTFYWSVHPSAPGTYRGTVWLFLHFIDRVTKEESSMPISAQTIQISTSDVLGIGGSLARMVGGLGSVVGVVLGFPFADDVLKWLWRRIRRG